MRTSSLSIKSTVRRIAQNETGTTLVEFAFVGPVLCLMLVGLFDIGFQIYAQTQMQGALQQSARKSTLEPTITTTDALDSSVRESVHQIIPNATVTFSRKNYSTFSDVNKPEDFDDDVDVNGVCDAGERFEDVNGNGVWDTDRGRNGLGGARDAVLYTVTASYDRLFPLDSFLEVPEAITVEANTVLRNQPYDGQGDRVPVIGNCP